MLVEEQRTSPERPVAIVTGGLQGLGLAIAQSLLAIGFDIAIIDLAANAELPSVLTAPSEGGGTCRYYQMDIANIEAHGPLLSQISSDFGRLDCLVNNAGIAARPLTDIMDLGPDAFDRSVEVNLRGTFFLTQAFAKNLIANGSATQDFYRSIILITSIAAELSFTDRPQYCVTKSALSMVTKLFAARLARENIHVHEVRPGLMRTPMTAKTGSDTIEKLLASGAVPIARWGLPEDVGRTVAALASGALPYMTGQPIWTAGGLNIPRIL